MLDLTNTQYRVVLVTKTGEQIPLPALRSSSMSENDGALAAQLQFDADNVLYNGKWLHSWAALASWIVGQADWGSGWQEVYRGKVFVNTPVTDPLRHFQLTAYDPLISLDKSQDDRYYAAGKTGKQIITDILNAWNVPIGQIDGPNKVLGIQKFQSMSVAQMIFKVLVGSRLLGDTDYVLRWSGGKANVLAVGQNSTVYQLKEDNVVTSASDQWSIENLVTRVKITGSTSANGPVTTKATVDGQTQYGVLQQIVAGSSYPTLGEAKTAAQNILDLQGKPQLMRQIVAVDLPFLRRGDAVDVQAGTISGKVIVSGVQHDWTNRSMTVQFNRLYANTVVTS